MKTKLFTLFLALVASVGTLFASTKIGDLYYNLDATNLTAEVTYQYRWSDNNYSGLSNAIIPSTVTYNAQQYSVTSIGNSAFYNCSGLTSVIIPNSVTSIGNWAFYECSGLTSVTIPGSVTSIGDYAFQYCSGLTSVTIGNSVTSIGKYTFSVCSGLTSVTIPNSVTSIGDYAFLNCSGLTSVTIGNSVTSIGEFTFAGCSGLTSVTIPNSVTSIGYAAFRSVPNIVYNGEATGSPWGAKCVNGYVDGWLVYSDNTQTTLVACFAAAIGEIILPNSVTSIGNYAFNGCSGLTSVSIPNSVTSIGDWAFYYCSGLTSVTIGNSVTSIGEGAFSYCSGLTSVTCEVVTPPTLGNGVFNGVVKSILLYVPAGSVDAYQAADQWKDFTNILALPETEEVNCNIHYVDKDAAFVSSEQLTFNVPEAPAFDGFTFLRWEFVGGPMSDGLTIQAVYQVNPTTSAPAVVTNPANPAQKLIREGNVYILHGDKTYTLTGQAVR